MTHLLAAVLAWFRPVPPVLRWTSEPRRRLVEVHWQHAARVGGGL